MNTTTEPVAVGATLEGALHAVILATFTVLTVFDWWHPTPEQTGAIAALYAAFVVLVKAVVAVWQRSQVTPVAKAEAAVVEARQAGIEQGAVATTGPVTLTSWRQGRP